MRRLNLADLEVAARARLSDPAWAYYASGADDELTLAQNRAAWAEHTLHYRVLVDVAERALGTTMLGQPIALPIAIAPTAFHRLAHADGELATARAARAAGTIMIVSTLSNTRIEDVVATGATTWFQLYVYKDRAVTERLIARAEAAGCRALVLTVDAPLLGQRERDVRGGFTLPAGLGIANLLPEGMAMGELPAVAGDSALTAYFGSLIDPSLAWRDLAWLTRATKLPLVLKGVVRPDDARRAVDHGCAAIVVSNHGGRQLDGAPATAAVLAPIVDAVAGRAEVYVDGGVRRGTDVVRALALGARAVLLGRPILWGLAVGGDAGVGEVLGLLRAELDRAMALCGAPTVAAIDRGLLDVT